MSDSSWYEHKNLLELRTIRSTQCNLGVDKGDGWGRKGADKLRMRTCQVFAGLNLIAFIILFCSPILTFAYMGIALMSIGMILTTTSAWLVAP